MKFFRRFLRQEIDADFFFVLLRCDFCERVSHKKKIEGRDNCSKQHRKMTKLILLLLVQFASLATAKTNIWRVLEDEQGKDEQGNENVANNQNGVDQMKGQFEDGWSNVTSRIDEDLNGMWTTTPSEWGDEYWEVLATAAGFALFVFACFCLCCVAPCCYDNSNNNNNNEGQPLRVVTQADVNHQKTLNQPILATNYENSLHQQSEGNDMPSRRRRRITLWEETKLAWKDFFDHGLTVKADDKFGSPKRKKTASPRKSTSPRNAGSPRKTKSPRNTTSPRNNTNGEMV